MAVCWLQVGQSVIIATGGSGGVVDMKPLQDSAVVAASDSSSSVYKLSTLTVKQKVPTAGKQHTSQQEKATRLSESQCKEPG